MTLDIEDSLRKPVEMFQEGYYDVIVPALLPFAIAVMFGVTLFGSMMGMAFVGMGSKAFIGLVGMAGIYVLVLMIVSIIAEGAIVYMAYKKLSGIVIDYRDGINVAVEKIVPLIVASVIIAIGIAVGLILLVIPSIVWALLTMFTTMEIMIAGKDGIEAIKSSINIVKQNFVDVLVFAIALLIVASIINFVVGLIPYIGSAIATLIVTPYTGIAVTHAYMQLTKPNG